MKNYCANKNVEIKPNRRQTQIRLCLNEASTSNWLKQSMRKNISLLIYTFNFPLCLSLITGKKKIIKILYSMIRLSNILITQCKKENINSI